MTWLKNILGILTEPLQPGPEIIYQWLRREDFLGAYYLLIWVDLRKGSEAYEALSQLLFDYSAVRPKEEAPIKDLSDPALHRKVAECIIKHPESLRVARKLFREMVVWEKTRKVWHNIPIQVEERGLASLEVFLNWLHELQTEYGEYEVGYGISPHCASDPVDLEPIVDACASDRARDILLTMVDLADNKKRPYQPMQLRQLLEKLICLQENRGNYNVECHYPKVHCADCTLDDCPLNDPDDLDIHFPVVGIGVNKECRIVGLLGEPVHSV